MQVAPEASTSNVRCLDERVKRTQLLLFVHMCTDNLRWTRQPCGYLQSLSLATSTHPLSDLLVPGFLQLDVCGLHLPQSDGKGDNAEVMRGLWEGDLRLLPEEPFLLSICSILLSGKAQGGVRRQQLSGFYSATVSQQLEEALNQFLSGRSLLWAGSEDLQQCLPMAIAQILLHVHQQKWEDLCFRKKLAVFMLYCKSLQCSSPCYQTEICKHQEALASFSALTALKD